VIEIVAATRLSETERMGSAALGISLGRLDRDRRITAQVEVPALLPTLRRSPG
jgi:hypothetical protein